MAWAFDTTVTSTGSAGNESSSNSLTATWSQPFATNLAAGDVGMCFVACDNVGTTDGDLAEITSVTDSSLNTWVEVGEWTNGQGSAATGATVAAYYCNISTALVAGVGTVTVNFANNVTAKAMRLHRLTKTSSNSVAIGGTVQTEVTDNADVGSLSLSSLTNQEYIFFRVISQETDTSDIGTATTNYTKWQFSRSGTGGNEKGHISLCGEYRILTGTGDSSNPALSDTTCDTASVYFALYEFADAPIDYKPGLAPFLAKRRFYLVP